MPSEISSGFNREYPSTNPTGLGRFRKYGAITRSPELISTRARRSSLLRTVHDDDLRWVAVHGS